MGGEGNEDNDEPEDVQSVQLTALFYAVNSYHNFYMTVNFCIKLPE
jgi:hypothetical protein